MDHDLDEARRKSKQSDFQPGVLYKTTSAKGVEFRLGPQQLRLNGEYQVELLLTYDDLKLLFDEVARQAEREAA